MAMVIMVILLNVILQLALVAPSNHGSHKNEEQCDDGDLGGR